MIEQVFLIQVPDRSYQVLLIYPDPSRLRSSNDADSSPNARTLIIGLIFNLLRHFRLGYQFRLRLFASRAGRAVHKEGAPHDLTSSHTRTASGRSDGGEV